MAGWRSRWRDWSSDDLRPQRGEVRRLVFKYLSHSGNYKGRAQIMFIMLRADGAADVVNWHACLINGGPCVDHVGSGRGPWDESKAAAQEAVYRALGLEEDPD